MFYGFLFYTVFIIKKDGEKMRRKKRIKCVLFLLVVIMGAFTLGSVYASGQFSGDKNIAAEAAAGPGKISEGILTLVNADHPMPSDWEYELVELRNGQNIDSRAYEDLQQMMDDARAEGLDPYICSSWRSHETQEQLFEEEIADYVEKGYSESEARVRAAEWVAVPGTSEHELGLALDIVSEENQRLEEAQKDTPTQQWLMAHCYEYGFILRYPKDKEDITGISYEPWHYRYVGREDAAAIRDLGVCLEEYLEQK